MNSTDADALSGALQQVTIDGGGGAIEMRKTDGVLTPHEESSLASLKQLQQKHAELAEAFERELRELKMLYEKRYAPLYLDRSKVLAQKPSDEPSNEGTPALPNFWLRALKSNHLLSEMIESADESVFSYLQDITCEYLTPEEQKAIEEEIALTHDTPQPTSTTTDPNPESFRLVFTFKPNPFFKQTRLCKEFRLTLASGGRGAELTSTHSTTIDWEEGKDVTKKTVLRKQRNKKTKQTRTVAESVDADSFFNLFKDHEIPSDDKLEKMSEKEVQELQMIVEADYDIGVTIRDKIIPRAVDWFLGEASDESDYDDFDEDDDEYDSDMDSCGDDEEDEPLPKGAAKAKGVDAEGKPECKQQ